MCGTLHFAACVANEFVENQNTMMLCSLTHIAVWWRSKGESSSAPSHLILIWRRLSKGQLCFLPGSAFALSPIDCPNPPLPTAEADT